MCLSRTCAAGICGTLPAPVGVSCGPNQQCDGQGNCVCATGFQLCGGTCVALNDVNNCGACGNACQAPANATAVCANGVCSYTCNAGFKPCGASCIPNNMCCSAAECPPVPNGQPICSNGVCGGICNAGFADCNNNLADGCEVNIMTSPNNCGACGRICPSGPNSFPVCSNGNCQLVCASGFANCDGNPLSGCEANLTTDANNCGGCGLRCPTSPCGLFGLGHYECQGGTCVCVGG